MRAMVQGMIGFIASGALILVAFVFLLSCPPVAALALWGGCGAAQWLTTEFEDFLAGLFFYGALAGCGVVWFG